MAGNGGCLHYGASCLRGGVWKDLGCFLERGFSLRVRTKASELRRVLYSVVATLSSPVKLSASSLAMLGSDSREPQRWGEKSGARFWPQWRSAPSLRWMTWMILAWMCRSSTLHASARSRRGLATNFDSLTSTQPKTPARARAGRIVNAPRW